EKEPSTYEELMDVMARQNIELLDAPGKIFSYNNECYCLLGALIERVSGISYESYVKENIIKLIGMKHTGFSGNDFGDYDNITTLYLQGKKEGSIAGLQIANRKQSLPTFLHTSSRQLIFICIFLGCPPIDTYRFLYF